MQEMSQSCPSLAHSFIFYCEVRICPSVCHNIHTDSLVQFHIVTKGSWKNSELMLFTFFPPALKIVLLAGFG